MVCLLCFDWLIVALDCVCLFVMLDVLGVLLVCNNVVLVLFFMFFKLYLLFNLVCLWCVVISVCCCVFLF